MSRSAANVLNRIVGSRGRVIFGVLGWIEERAAPRRTGPYHFVGARGRVVFVFGFFRGCWGLLMPDNGGCTAGVAADLFSSFYLC